MIRPVINLRRAGIAATRVEGYVRCREMPPMRASGGAQAMVDKASTDIASNYIERVSMHDFAATVSRLENAIAQAGLTIFARIDHACAARDAGLTMPPTLILIYGNPHGGTPIMLSAPQAALDLPLRVLVRESVDGHVHVGFHPIVEVLRNAGVAEDLAARLVPAQALLIVGARS